MTQVYFSEARHADDVLRLALGAAQLPTDDLGGLDQMFFSLSDDDGLIGFVGLEGDGADRLLGAGAVQGFSLEPSPRDRLVLNNGYVEFQ